MSAIQYELFKKPWAALFDEWIHTPGGRHVANRCIRRAWSYWRRGKRMGMKAIWEIERWRFKQFKRYLASRGIKLKRVDGYAFNNNFTPYMARFIADREPRLKGFFEEREVGKERGNKTVVVLPARNKQQTA